MRRILAALGAALCGVSLAAAQSTTTTIGPTSSTTIPTSTSTSSSTSTSVSGSSTTSTSVSSSTTTVTIAACGTSDPSDAPKACAQSCKIEGGSKEGCRQTCCSGYFDALVEPCNAFSDCDDLAFDDFVEQWKNSNDFYNRCLRSDNAEDPTIGVAFSRYNLPNSCREYVGGCKTTALRHVFQCADADRCVTCCRTTLRRWRQALARDLLQAPDSTSRCRQAIRCVRRSSRKAEACRDACRRTPTCGQDELRECLVSRPAGREVLDCYGKCADKCAQPDAYPWCIQACNGINQCDAFDKCADVGTTTVTSTSDGTAFAARANGGACLIREDRTCEATLTTTSTSTSSSTARSTTSTSTSSTTLNTLP